MFNSIPNYRKCLFLTSDSLTYPVSYSTFPEVGDVMKKMLDAFVSPIGVKDDGGMGFFRTSKGFDGTNMNFGARASVLLAQYLGNLGRSTVLGSSVLSSLQRSVRVNYVDSDQNYEKTVVEDVTGKGLYEAMIWFGNFCDPHQLVNYLSSWESIQANIKTICEIPLKDEDSFEAYLHNRIIAFVRLYTMVLLSDMTFRLGTRSIDLIECLQHDKIEVAFEAWLQSEAVLSISNNFHNATGMSMKNFITKGVDVMFDVSYYEKLLNASVELILARSSDLLTWCDLKTQFTSDRKRVRRIHWMKTKAQVSALTTPELAIGFVTHEESEDMTESVVTDFISRFNTVYAPIIPLWTQFVKKFFSSTPGYFLPSTSTRRTVINQREAIYVITFLNPYMENNIVYSIDTELSRLEDPKNVTKYDVQTPLFEVSKTLRPTNEVDQIPLKSLLKEGDVKIINCLDGDIEGLMRRMAKPYQILRRNIESNEFYIKIMDDVSVVIQPSGIKTDVFIPGRRIAQATTVYTTETVDINTCSLLDFYFHIKPTETGSNLADFYKSRLNSLGSSYVIGQSLYVDTFVQQSALSYNSLLFFMARGKLPETMYFKMTNIVQDFELSTKRVGRRVKIARKQIVKFPVDKAQVIQMAYDQAPPITLPGYEGFKGDPDGFSLSMADYSPSTPQLCTGKLCVYLDRDVQLEGFSLVKSTDFGNGEDEYLTYIYSPQIGSHTLGAYKSTISYACLGKYSSIYDYITPDLLTKGAFDSVVRVLMGVYNDVVDNLYSSESRKKTYEISAKLLGVKKFLVDGIGVNQSAWVSESGILVSTVTWRDIIELIDTCISTGKGASSNKNDYDASLVYLAKFTELFKSDLNMLGQYSWSLENVNYTNIYKLLMDQFTGVMREPIAHTYVKGLRTYAPTPFIFDRDVSMANAIAKLNYKISSTVTSVVIYNDGLKN